MSLNECRQDNVKHKKRIGMITFHRTNNFGSQLQAMALYKALCNMNADCTVIDYHCDAIERREFQTQKSRVTSVKALVKKLLLEPLLNIKKRNMMRFLTKYARLSKAYDKQNIRQCVLDYDVFVVGSDIVWGVDITEGDMTYFLDFAPGREKYAFSSSVGTVDNGPVDPRIPALLKDFTRIYVRENTAADWVERVSGRKAGVVCDPTMLLTSQEWDLLIQPKQYKRGYVLVYFEDPSGKVLRDAKQYAAEHGLKVKYITYTIPPKGVSWERPTSVEAFIGLIKYADAVFTASYHGMLFSLYYEKQLYFYNRAHKSRMLSLAEILCISDRCADLGMTDKAIDYTIVRRKIEDFRAYSLMELERLAGRGED